MEHPAVGKNTGLIRLVSAFDRSDEIKDIAKESLDFLREFGGKDAANTSYHSKLCSAMLKVINGGALEYAELLHYAGPMQCLIVIHSNLSRVVTPVARWLANEITELLATNNLTPDLFAQCSSNPSPRLSPAQEQLVDVICRLPDLLANRLGRSLPATLLPAEYFKLVGRALYKCLERVYTSIKESNDCSLVFPAALLGKAALLGHKDALLSELIPRLECHTLSDPLWCRISQTLFSHIPTASLEYVLEVIVSTVSPSLLPSSPLHCLIGDLAVKNQKAKFVLTHKLILVRVPPGPFVTHTLIGYLSASEQSRELLVKCLQSALGVWSDGSALRHMNLRQHMWISRLIVLAFTSLKERERKELSPKIHKLVMSGVRVHLESALSEQRHIGMTVGECVFNKLNPVDKEHQLKFEYEASDEITSLKLLARPVAEQEAELKAWRAKNTTVLNDKDKQSQHWKGDVARGVVREEKKENRFGEGMVEATECSDTDSDDDLVPYAMTEDPDASVPTPPRYLRTLLQVLISPGGALHLEGALKVAANMIRTRPSDLREVCVELAKVLLHLSDQYSLDDFVPLRMSAMVALAVCCPDLVAPYLTDEFYAPNYSLRQRMDILEVLATAAVELSQPKEEESSSGPVLKEVRGRGGREGQGCNQVPSASQMHHPLMRKPWEDIIKERLKARTKIISKGPSKSPPRPVPNRFVGVAPLFFFPLMNQFDQPTNSLDLLGEDSLVLGNLLYTLGTVMYAATNIPLASAMATALLDFLWALRYHSSLYVRQGVLFALSMLIVSTPPHFLEELMRGAGLSEAVLWVGHLCQSEADSECRSLAQHTLALLNTAVKPTK